MSGSEVGLFWMSFLVSFLSYEICQRDSLIMTFKLNVNFFRLSSFSLEGEVEERRGISWYFWNNYSINISIHQINMRIKAIQK